MHHTLFAYFERQEDAASAIETLREEGLGEDRLEVVIHKDHLNEQAALLPEETDAREGLLKGILIGGGAGAATLGLLAGPIGLIGIGAPLAAAAFGAWAGSVFGGLGAVVMGSGVADHKLQELAKKLEDGGVIVTVVSHDSDTTQVVESVFDSYGAVEVHKPLL